MQPRDEYRNTAVIYDFLFSGALRKVRTQVCTVLDHQRAENIIDLCCGTGEQLRLLHNSNRLLTGVDLSPAMLKSARQKGPDSIHYLETDASALPFAEEDYDGVIISFGLHEKSAPRNEAIFREGWRLLRPGGVMLVVDYCVPPATIASQVVGRYLIPLIERAAGIKHYHNYRDWMKRGGIEAFLQEASPGRVSLVAAHFKGCIGTYMIAGESPHPATDQ